MLKHSSMSSAQLWPSHPTEQLQLYASMETLLSTVDSLQAELCWHGALKHSSISSAQLWPAMPPVQLHRYASNGTDVEEEEDESVHVVLYVGCRWHGLLKHSSRSSPQFSPDDPVTQEQLYESTAVSGRLASHMPSFLHGPLAHSSMSSAQLWPSHPTEQLQL